VQRARLNVAALSAFKLMRSASVHAAVGLHSAVNAGANVVTALMRRRPSNSACRVDQISII
jgi:hypothetical protein